MKNLYLLDTDKPSRLFYLGSNLHLEQGQLIAPKNYQNIYITNDEEIKEGDWVIWNDKVYKDSKRSFTGVDYSQCKKILLTTDQDLIKDGVQVIDDEFLEWFVKNLSCEKVEVVDNLKYFNVDELRERHLKGLSHLYSEKIGYKIIIPEEDKFKHPPVLSEKGNRLFFDEKGFLIKEEPKQEMRKVCKCKRAYKNSLSEICSLCWNELYPNEKDEIKDEDLLEPKQETLEEVAERLYPENWESIMDGQHDSNSYERTAFINGAKWQQEQDKKKYSEEEVINLLNKREDYLGTEPSIFDYSTNKEWFEQFSKLKNG